MILKQECSSIVIKNVCDYKLYLISTAVLSIFKNSINKPKILLGTCSTLNSLAPFLKLSADVEVVTNFPQGIFSYITHNNFYDLGMYCYKQKDGYKIKFYSGSGYVLSPQVFSIIANGIYNNKIDEKEYNRIIENGFENINVVDFSAITNKKYKNKFQKLVTSYINYYKKLISNSNLKVNIVSCCKELNFLLCKIFGDRIDKNSQITIYCSKKDIYFYNGDKFIDYKKLINKNEIIVQKAFNEYEMFKKCMENKRKYAKSNKIYVCANTYTFENISKAINVYNKIANSLTLS